MTKPGERLTVGLTVEWAKAHASVFGTIRLLGSIPVQGRIRMRLELLCDCGFLCFHVPVASRRHVGRPFLLFFALPGAPRNLTWRFLDWLNKSH